MKYYNYSAGPSALFTEVVDQIRADLGNWNSTHSSVMEISHRSPEYMEFYREMVSRLRTLLRVPDSHEILFMHGGGRGQFASVPMNIEQKHKRALYLISGHWSRLASIEAKKYTEVLSSDLTDKNGNITKLDWTEESKNCDYVYYCSNETVDGIEIVKPPKVDKDTLIVTDMSSNILSRPIEVNDYDVIFAGAQKNIGAAGITIVIVRKSVLGKASKICPEVFDWTVASTHDSMINTPATFSWYTCSLTFGHILKHFKTLEALESRNIEKSTKLYNYLDNEEFYNNHINKETRSRMNVVFRTPSDELDKLFVEESKQAGLNALKGHPVVGGLRASIYNALDLDAVDTLIDFMTKFANQHK